MRLPLTRGLYAIISDAKALNVMAMRTGQHFLLTRQAKTLSLAQVFQMSDAEAEATFKRIRWADTNGEPVCPHCGVLDVYDCRRPNGAPRFRCKGCGKDFSITSGTLFASHKLPLRGYLAAIAIFCNEVKGKSMLALSRDLGLSYKAAFVLGAQAARGDGRRTEGPPDRRRSPRGRGRRRLLRRPHPPRQQGRGPR